MIGAKHIPFPLKKQHEGIANTRIYGVEPIMLTVL
jgi:hypothetical protein